MEFNEIGVRIIVAETYIFKMIDVFISVGLFLMWFTCNLACFRGNDTYPSTKYIGVFFVIAPTVVNILRLMDIPPFYLS